MLGQFCALIPLVPN